MASSTDETIEIQCSECEGNHMEVGLEAMIHHIQECHPNAYPTHLIASEYAMLWMEDAYDKEDQANADYYQQRKEDPSE